LPKNYNAFSVGIFLLREYAHERNTSFMCPDFSSTIDINSRKQLERLDGLENGQKRRNRLYIIADILTMAKEGSLKTKIMYGANLSFAQLTEYLSFLTKMHLLKIHNENGKSIYRTTDKGSKYIEKYKDITKLLGNNDKEDS
jgi:predicted transcriptional regulator